MLAGASPDTNGLLPGIAGKRCAHCNTQTTPLWRNGPDGAKTLCNACGVRDNRRHAKTRGAASRPRPRKESTTNIAATTARLKKQAQMALDGDDGEVGGRRSARWNAGLLTKRAKAESADADLKRAQKRQRVFAHHDHSAPGADVGPDGTIWTPMVNDIADYDANTSNTFVPSNSYIQARPNTPGGRFAPGSAAPLYDATSSDKAWLTEVNHGRPQGTELRERQLEQLFDVFEEASWHSGAMPESAHVAYDVLGYGGASVAEAEAAMKGGALGDIFAELTDEDDHVLSNGLAMHSETWDAVDPLKGRSKSHGSEKSDRSYTPPLTPNGSIELGAGFVRADSASLSVDGFSGSPGGSVPSRSVDDTDVDASENGSDAGEGSVFGSDASGNEKSSDLAAAGLVKVEKRATRASRLQNTNPKAAPLKVNKGTSELKERLTDGKDAKNARRIGVLTGVTKKPRAAHHTKKKLTNSNSKGREMVNVRETRRATRATKGDTDDITVAPSRSRVTPSAADAELAFRRYKKLRAENGRVALLARFARPAPPQLRARALLGGVSGSSGAKEHEAEAANVMAAAAAGEYQFVLGFEGVQRQQRERASRGEAIKEASRRRRRRACFNPAASKRRRKQQAALEIAIEAPLQIVHDASELFLGYEFKHEQEVAPLDTDVQVDHAANNEPHEPYSEWESDDDVPLAALADREESPDLTLADIAAQSLAEDQAAEKAKRAAAKKAALAAKALKPEPEHPSVMAKVASAASCVLSRFIGTAKPTVSASKDAFLVDSPSTPRKRRTPRARKVKTEA